MTTRHPITLKGLVYSVPGADAVTVRQVGEMDIYSPAGPGPHPIVLVVHGYNDAGVMKILGCRFKDMQSYIDWARNFAASGIAAILYSNQDAIPDLAAVVEQLKAGAGALNLDLERFGIYAASGNAPLALSLLKRDAPAAVRCAALLCPETLDLDGGTEIAGAAAQFKFANPMARTSVEDLASNIPIFIARAGQDEMPGLNIALDRFVAHLRARNMPVTLVDHPTAPHAFDLMDDSATSRDVMRQLIDFLRVKLSNQ